jgi:4-carboxymuconolactone decarboxylase
MEPAMPKKTPSKKIPNLPGPYKAFITKFPELGAAHEAISLVVAKAGPLDEKQCSLIKIGLSVGAGLESAVRAHVRRAMKAGATEQEVEQAILLAYNTLGWPRTVAAWTWARQQIERGE